MSAGVFTMVRDFKGEDFSGGWAKPCISLAAKAMALKHLKGMQDFVHGVLLEDKQPLLHAVIRPQI